MIAFDVEECPLFKNVHTYSFFKILLGCKTREVCLKIEEIQKWRGNVVIFWWIGVFFFSSSFLSGLIGVGNAGKNKYEVKSMVGKLGR